MFYGIKLMNNDHSDNDRRNPLILLQGLLSDKQQGIFYMHNLTDRIVIMYHSFWSIG